MGTYENPGSVSGVGGVNIMAQAAATQAAAQGQKGVNKSISEWSALQAKKNANYLKNQQAAQKAREKQWIKASKDMDKTLSETEAGYTTGGQTFDQTYVDWGTSIKDNVHHVMFDKDPDTGKPYTAQQISKAQADANINIENQQTFMGLFHQSIEEYKGNRGKEKGKAGSWLNSNEPGMIALYDDFVDNGGENVTMNPPVGTQQTMTYHNPNSVIRDDEENPILKDGKPQYMTEEEFEQWKNEDEKRAGEVYSQTFDMSDYLKRNKDKNTGGYSPIAYQPDINELLSGSVEAIQKDMGYGKTTQTTQEGGRSVTTNIYDNEGYWESLNKKGTWDYVIDSPVSGQAAGVWEGMGNTSRWIGSGHDSVPPNEDWNNDGVVDDEDEQAYKQQVQLQRNILAKQLAEKAYKDGAKPNQVIKSQRVKEQKLRKAEKDALAKKPLYKDNSEKSASLYNNGDPDAATKATTLMDASLANGGTTSYKSLDQLKATMDFTGYGDDSNDHDQGFAAFTQDKGLTSGDVVSYTNDDSNTIHKIDLADKDEFNKALNKASGITDSQADIIQHPPQQGTPGMIEQDNTTFDPEQKTQPQTSLPGQAVVAQEAESTETAVEEEEGDDPAASAVSPNVQNNIAQYNSNPGSYGAAANQSGEAEWTFGGLKIKSTDFKNGALKTDGPNGYIHKLMNFEDSAGGFDGKAVENYGFTGTGKEGAILLDKFEEYENQGKSKSEAAEATINEYIIGSDPTVKKDGKPTILNELNMSRDDFDKLPDDTKELLVGYKMNSGRDIADLLVIASGGDWDGRKAHRGSIDKNLVKAVDITSLTPNQLETARQALYVGRIKSMQEMVDDPNNDTVSQSDVNTAKKGWFNSQQHRSNFKFPEYSSKEDMENDKNLKPGESVIVIENGKKLKYIIQS